MAKKDDAAPEGADANSIPARPAYEIDDFGDVVPHSENDNASAIDRGVAEHFYTDASEPPGPSDAAAEAQPAELVDSMRPPPITTMTPDEWQELLFSITGEMPRADAWKHGAAEALHNWQGHAHHQGAPIQLTRQDYEAALEAATKTDASGAYEPHEAAMGRSEGKV